MPKYKTAKKPPQGLTVDSIEIDPNCEKEIRRIFENYCKDTISLNNHFFISNPFPLVSSEGRTHTVFSVDDPLISQTMKEIKKMFSKLGANYDDLINRCNIIVRLYDKKDSIGFHVDDLKCESTVYGLILHNSCPEKEGLTFIKDNQKYVLTENEGTIFSMGDEARYKWKHGLFPLTSGQRISVTCRIFKESIIKDFDGEIEYFDVNKADAKKISNKLVIRLINNINNTQSKTVNTRQPVTLKMLKTFVKNKFRINAKRFFTDYAEVTDVVEFIDDPDNEGADILDVYFSKGEDFTKSFKEPPELPKEPEYFGLMRFQEIREQKNYYEKYKYCSITFEVKQGTEELEGVEIFKDMYELGEKIENAELTIPELREIIYAIHNVVEKNENIYWGFKTDLGPEKRTTSIFIIEDGEWVMFKASANLALKGRKKRDGPLWKLNGGLNNVYKPKIGDKNAYQSKRGVVTLDDFVLFAGSHWPSSYYSCSFKIDERIYTSVAQYVLSEQALLFKDQERYEELMKVGVIASPHKLFDHKAPKTGERQVKNFDIDIWKNYADVFMYKGCN